MATALLISRTDLVKNTIVDGNVDTDKFIQFIRIAQEIHIQNYLGTSLLEKIQALIIAGTLTQAANPDYYNLVNDYIKDMLVHFAMVDYIPFASYQIQNKGVFKHTSENSETATKEELDFLIERHRSFAQFFTRRFLDYICNNSSKFPEYNSGNQEDMYPDTTADFTGWVL
tara:strand:- start:570 stop:1082 length:513 start_codon:yes stop_codon:yes gene_type:complete